MPCSKCNSDFNVLNWKLKCFECETNFCSKCLTKVYGNTYCDVCAILIIRPPIRDRLMELKSKDLQNYLNKNNVSTYGIVEKQELVELFYKKPMPATNQKSSKKFYNPLSGSLPNKLGQNLFQKYRSNAETTFNTRNWTNGGRSSEHFAPRQAPPPPPPPRPPPPQPSAPPADPIPEPSTNAGEGSQADSSPLQRLKLSDFHSPENLNDLSVKQLKELLNLNRVDYKGCVEKAELLERVNRLWQDCHMRKTDESNENFNELCKICMDAQLDCVLLECGHMATCIDCGKRLAECPICRQYVTRVVRTFKV
ncbi:PREDICTED: E3 ubiquitin-protein ligase RNF34 [Nicrophorus vespilloides]|uniref:E3 ubiquitin-protein ligase RNF34 n=1 Tax=Nicrophorus vespilloides TaxID=110193 RepID=A0ABM1MB22_NICVS|nr:PREDICTED: E3 ubiquitin-protein ligase RNF34 [Nicrophorus vespilloides]